MSTTIISTGRFSPMTIGHSLLFKKMTLLKKHFKADRALLYATHSHDPKRNPLQYDDKIRFLQAIMDEKYPAVEVINSPAGNIIESLIELDGTTDEIIVIAGQDRVEEFERLLLKYNGKEYNYDSIKVISAGDRDPDRDITSGMSATKMRGYAAANDYQSFRRGIDTFDEDLVREIFDATRRGMNIVESGFSIRDAHTLKQLREYCRLREEDPAAEEEPPLPSVEFLSRANALIQKAGGEGSEEGLKLEPNEDGAALMEKYPYVDPATYVGIPAVLFLDNIVGTKFTTQYVGRFYDIISESLKGKLSVLRVVVRKLAEMSEEDVQIQEMNIRIAWDSEVGNPTHFQSREEKQIDFAVENTEELLKTIGGDRVHLHSIGSLTQKDLTGYVAQFNKQWEERGNKAKQFDAKSLTKYLVQNGMTGVGNTSITKERDALGVIKEFQLAFTGEKPPTADEVNKFSESYGVDKKILANYLQSTAFDDIEETEGKDEKERRMNLESTLADWDKAYGLGGLFAIVDMAAEDVDNKKAKKEEEEAKQSEEPQKTPPSSPPPPDSSVGIDQ